MPFKLTAAYFRFQECEEKVYYGASMIKVLPTVEVYAESHGQVPALVKDAGDF